MEGRVDKEERVINEDDRRVGRKARYNWIDRACSHCEQYQSNVAQNYIDKRQVSVSSLTVT